MDTRFWGPSGWELFHLIAFRSPHPDDVLNIMKDVLPCKFCRASTTKYVHDHPLRGNPGKWLYEIHNMVNNKLRTQCADDPTVVDPGEDPEFTAVKAKYMAMKPTRVPGRDFLMSVAYVYPADPESTDWRCSAPSCTRWPRHIRSRSSARSLPTMWRRTNLLWSPSVHTRNGCMVC